MDYFRDAIGASDTMEATPVADGFTKATPEQWAKMRPEERQSYLKSARENANKPAATPAPKTDYFRDAIGTVAPATAPNSAPTDPNATPDAPTLVGKAIQAFTGKQDPRYKDTPAFRPDEAGFDAVGKGNYAAGVIAGNSDDGMADAIAKQLGPRHILSDKDANGYPIIHYYDEQGKSQKAYVNRPGLDFQDVARTVVGALPYVVTGGAVGGAMKGAGMLAQTGAQALTAGATNLATQGARKATGSEQPLSGAEVLETSAGGALGPALSAGAGALMRRFVTVPGLFDKATGTLTEKGIEAAKRAGIDPAELTPDVAKKFATTLAATKDEAQAAVQATTSPFNIPVSKGQMTKDPYLLTQEEAMRRRLFGEQAQGVMNEFDTKQAQAIKAAALGDGNPLAGSGARPGIATTINPDRTPGWVASDANPATLGESVREGVTAAREGARAAENKAWDAVPKMTPTQAAMDMLPDHLEGALSNFVVDENTPVASAMVKRMGQFVRGENPSQVDPIMKTSPVKDVDRMRRQLLKMQGSAQGEDARTAGAIYGAFNEWIDSAAEKALLSGDASAAASLKSARGFTKEVREIFSPQVAGRTSPAANRVAQVLEGADTPEGVINALLGSQGSKTINNGGVGALRSVKLALDKFAEPEVARQTWNDIRLAYWVRLVQGKNGELVGPTAMLNNIKTAFANQKSAVETLYQPGEIVRIRQFVRALEAVSYKPPNASGSGYTAAGLAKDMVGKFFEAFGLNSKIAQGAIEYTGVGNAYGGAAARSAVSPSVTNINPNLAGATAASTNALARD